MSSNDRATNEAIKQTQTKRLSGTHSNFKVEWLKDPDLKS